MTKGLKEQCDKILSLEEQRMRSKDEVEIKRLENEIEKLTMMLGIGNINNINQVDNYLFPKLQKLQSDVEGARTNEN